MIFTTKSANSNYFSSVDISLAALNSGKYLVTFRKVTPTDNRKELIAGIKDAVILTQRDGRISAVNRPAELLFGYTEDELLDELPSVITSQFLLFENQ